MMSRTVPPVRRLPVASVPPEAGYAIRRGSATSRYHIAARRTFRPSGRQTECGNPCLAESFRPPAFSPTQPRSHTRTDHGSQRRCRRFPAGEIRVLPALSPFGVPPERLARARIASLAHAARLTCHPYFRQLAVSAARRSEAARLPITTVLPTASQGTEVP